MNLNFLDRSSRKVLDLPLDQIHPDPDQPRRDFQDLDQLAASLVALGVQQPLLVRKVDEDASQGGYQIVAGERRWRAAGQAQLQSLPCLLLPEEQASDLGLLRAAQLTENLQRSDLSMMEIAQGLQAALDQSDISKAKLASLLGKSRTFVHRHLALLQATGTPAEALAEGRLPCTETFRLFIKLDEGEQTELLTMAREDDRTLARGELKTWSRRDEVAAAAAAQEHEAQEVDGREEERQEPAQQALEQLEKEQPAPPATEPDPQPPARTASAKTGKEDTVRLVLQQHQVLWLLQQLGAEPPEDPELLASALLEVLP